MSTAIKVENVSKAYQLGSIGTGTITKDIERWFAKIRGKEDPMLKIGEQNDRTMMGTSDVVWSLKDIDFEIEQGTAVGIIGSNGAGKSTLLKILSKVTAPTTGRITGKGRIASLLEVGTGFHPELTGKENIYLNGAILGMRKNEIKRKFDEIVEFAGVGRYINTPVKRYSSGMYVRLAFAVAAHLESEILIVDEVLAVGDAEFQKKCLGKMGEVSKGEGRTVLFVSHNMPAIKKLCQRCIHLSKGTVEHDGPTEQILEHYFRSNKSAFEKVGPYSRRSGSGTIQFFGLDFLNAKQVPIAVALTGEPLIFKFLINASVACRNVDIGFSIHDEEDNMLSVLYSSYQGKTYNVEPGLHEFFFEFPENFLSNATYIIRGIIKDNNLIADMPANPLNELLVEVGNFYGTNSIGHQSSKLNFLVKGKWS